MSIRISLSLIVCLVVAGWLASQRVADGQGEPVAAVAAPDIAADFKGKIVLFEVNRSNALESKSGSVVLNNVRITKMGARDFIVGDGYAPEGTDDSWYKDMTVGVPCDAVLRFHAMTPAQFTNYLKLWKDQSSTTE